MIAVQLITSAWSWLSSNASTCTQSQAKDPQVNSDNSSTETVNSISVSITVIGNPVPAKLFQQNIHTLMPLLGDEIVRKTHQNCKVLEANAAGECHKFALNFFALQFVQDSTLITNEKKWPEIFSKIESICNKAFDDVVACRDDIGLGYSVLAGMPLSLAQKEGGSPILFIDVETEPGKGKKYVEVLCKLVPERMLNFAKMKNFNEIIIEKIILTTGIFYQIDERAADFVHRNIVRSLVKASNK